MDTINKQLYTPPSSTKRFFNFGKKKTPEKNTEKNTGHLHGQLQELNNKLQQIDMDLTTHINQSNHDGPIDYNQNWGSKSDLSRTSNGNSGNDVQKTNNFKESDKDINRSDSLKLNVKKLAKTTFSKSLNKKPKKGDISSPFVNGHHSDSSVLDAFGENNNQPDVNDEFDDSGDESLQRTDSLTDLTRQTSLNDNVFSVNGPSSQTNSKTVSPYKEIRPDLMAEIDVSTRKNAMHIM